MSPQGIFVRACSDDFGSNPTNPFRVVSVRKYDFDGRELWVRELYPPYECGEREYANSRITVDETGVYIYGWTGHTYMDIYVRKYDFDGNELWTRTFGTGYTEEALGLATDSTGLYVAGWTEGEFFGQTYSGTFDPFLVKYDRNGNYLWSRQFGTAEADPATGVATQAGAVYVVGHISPFQPGFFIRAFDPGGSVLWTRRSGADVPEALWPQIAATSSGIYIVWYTSEYVYPPGGYLVVFQGYLRKYSFDGNELWTRPIAAHGQYSTFGVAANENGVYVAGTVGGDVLVAKYDSNGNGLWTSLVGTPNWEAEPSIAVDSNSVYVTGQTSGASGEGDIFVAKIESSMNPGCARSICLPA